MRYENLPSNLEAKVIEEAKKMGNTTGDED